LLALGLTVVVAAAYVEEDWRGLHAWNHTKEELEAKGCSLDWARCIPAAVPDGQNIFKAPKMEEWFAGKGPTELSRRLGTLYEFAKRENTNALAEVVIVRPEASVARQSADLVLRYRFSALTLDSPEEPGTGAATPECVIIPLIVMQDVPLTDAITNLARQAKLTYVLDPSVGFRAGEPQPTVSVRWQNITAQQALMALLSSYNLEWLEDPNTGIARIVPQDPSGPRVRVALAVRDQTARLLERTLTEDAAASPTVLRGAQGIPLASKPFTVAKPARLTVRSDKVPTAKEISDFFPTNALGFATRANDCLRAEPVGSNVFRVFLGPPLYYTAVEYLAWSDQFTDDFALIREALKRPSARLDGDYLHPLTIPHPNFVMVRMTIQTLAQRAQSFLLLGRPQEALHELTLVHDLCRILDAQSSNRPVTLVMAMINVAVTGVYVQVLADGFRLRAWREPQLAALQQQLETIDLPPQLVAALRTQGASLCRAFEELGPRKVVQSDLFKFAEPKQPDFWQTVKDARTALLVLAPRGWVYQNMALAASLNQLGIDVFDPASRTVLPRRVDRIGVEFEKTLGHVTPQNFMAAVAVPNFTRAWEVLAQNQTLANQALVACALERYRLDCSEYPATLEALVPRWADSLPRDIIGGQPFRYRREQKTGFVLYSIGWNGTDEGGKMCRSPEGRPALREGDWVWQ
jgi:hypothetical protein